MKILITGQNSYIGTSFETWVKQQNPDWIVDTIDVRREDWKNISFAGYNAILHVAGIAHTKEKKSNEALYYQVNRDLAVQIATKSKKDGVGQFVFLSSMSVYGAEIGEIDLDTMCSPKTAYGKSKLEAEVEISRLGNNQFVVSILRPPMVYGEGCKGNFNSLVAFVNFCPIFPDVKNNRSMIYIDNLSRFLEIIIKNRTGGVLFPQNNEYSNTSEIIKYIAIAKGKKIYLFPGFARLILFLSKRWRVFSKVFGSLTYSKEISKIKLEYQVVGLHESIIRSLNL